MLRRDFLGASPHPNPPPHAGEGLFRRSPTPSLACGGGLGWGLGRRVRAAPIFLVSLHDRRFTSTPPLIPKGVSPCNSARRYRWPISAPVLQCCATTRRPPKSLASLI